MKTKKKQTKTRKPKKQNKMAKDRLEELNGDARHPVFEIAEENPVFIVDGTVYTSSQGEVDKSQDYFNDKKMFGLINKTQQIIEVGSITSLDELVAVRSADEMEAIGRNYAKRILSEQIMPYFAPQRDLDIPQTIFKQVFPYLREENYDNKIAGVLGIEKETVNGNGKDRKKAGVSPELKKIAGELYRRVEAIAKEIETPVKKRSEDERRLDFLLGDPEQLKENDSIFANLMPNNYAIIGGAVYNMGADNGDDFVIIHGKKYGFTKAGSGKKADFEIGDKIRMNSAASDVYDYTKEGSEGIVHRIDDKDDRVYVRFTKQTGAPERDADTWAVKKIHMENLSKGNVSSAKNLESKYYERVSKKLRANALRKHLSKEKILEEVLERDSEIILMRGKEKYSEEDFGFLTHNGSYYVYLTVPEFAIRSQFDSNLYHFPRARVGFSVYSESGELNYNYSIQMIDNNNHPFLHNNRRDFADICVGGQDFPTSGKDKGEVIAKRLRRTKEMLMFGYTHEDYRSCYELRRKCKSCESGHFSDNLMSESEAKRRNITIIDGGERR